MPAVHSRHRHSLERAQTITHMEHQGIYDVTSVFEIVAPSPPRYSSIDIQVEAALSLSLSTPPTATSLAGDILTRIPVPKTALIHPPQATTSKYPKPSPPSFLYPQPIVPPQVHSHTMRRNNDDEYSQRPFRRSFAHKEPSEAPTSFVAVLVFVVIAVAATWAVVVMLIHWRKMTTGMQPVYPCRRISEQKGAKGRNWWTWRRRPSPRAEKRGYEVLRSADGLELSHVDRRHALRSAHDLSAQMAQDVGIESPVNPYLVPPEQALQRSIRRLKPQGSAEWAEERRAFFSAESSEVQSRGSSSSSLLSEAELEDVECEAREAQARRASSSHNQLDANRSWVDQGLAAVDGAVDKVAGKIIRWTDDGGKDEALLLPLAKGKQD